MGLGDDINDAFIKDRVLHILKDRSISKLRRSFAAYALCNIKKDKKGIATSVLKFLKPIITQDIRSTRVALIALHELTGESYATNYGAWQKTIDAMPDDQVSSEKAIDSQNKKSADVSP